MNNENTNIMLVGGTGGHGEQLYRIRQGLKEHKVCIFTEVGMNWPQDDDIYYVSRVVDYHKASFLKSGVRFVGAMWKALRVLIKRDIGLLISTGPAFAVPVCIIARILKVKVIHIESWSRINTTSNTTRIILKYKLSDVVVYQYPKHILSSIEKCEYWGHL